MLKINGTLEQLLNNLHESTLQIVPSKDGKNSADTSPLRLSVTAKYEQMAMRLYQPLSQFRLALNRTNSEGQRRSFDATLETRMDNYEDYVAKKKSEIAQLQKDWEVIVGEIWKLGVSCLGEDVMKDLLFSPQDTARRSRSHSVRPGGRDFTSGIVQAAREQETRHFRSGRGCRRFPQLLVSAVVVSQFSRYCSCYCR